MRNGIGKYFELKEPPIGPPKQYLVGHMRKVELTNGVHAWEFSSSRSVTEVVKNAERQLAKNGFKLPRKAETQLLISY